MCLKKLNRELPYDPAIPLLGIYLDKTFIQKDTCIPMFTVTLLTITKTWKQPKCPLIDQWIKKMRRVYTTEYYSDIKKHNKKSTSTEEMTRTEQQPTAGRGT